jgi:adenosylmethionine-8-amino-7-oxononanoate aminotransferase
MPDQDWLGQGFSHIWLPYAQMKNMTMPVPIVGAEGARLYCRDGRVLIDGVSSWWTACHGYNHPALRRALFHQGGHLPHVMLGGLANEPAYRLAGRLAGLTGLDRVFFSESGSVAVEIALKIALQYWRNRGHGQRTRFLAFADGYHGDTLGTMAVSDPVALHGAFAATIPPQFSTPVPRLESERRQYSALLDAHRHELAAVIVEPLVQGAGGMKFHDGETLRFIADQARARDLLFIADEIMTGFGRTGTMFATAEAGLVPDIMTLSKALTGGTLPLAATLASAKVFAAFHSDAEEDALMHGPTYSGNALACAVALAALDLFDDEPRLAQVARIADQLRIGLAPCATHPWVRDVRVKGALGVVELDRPSAFLRPAFLARNTWIRPFGSVIYLAPPFVIAESELTRLTDSVSAVLAAHGG